jgi:hypothetical protein
LCRTNDAIAIHGDQLTRDGLRAIPPTRRRSNNATMDLGLTLFISMIRTILTWSGEEWNAHKYWASSTPYDRPMWYFKYQVPAL